MSDKKIVLTTAASRDEAEQIASALVVHRLAACVNIVGPVGSVYRWQGAVERAEEWLLVIKTIAAALPRVREAIAELHSYDLPECLEIAVEGGSESYLEWIAQNVD